MESELTQNAASALGRSYGALFLFFFGGCWLLLSTYAFGALRAVQIVVIGLAVLAFAVAVLVIQRRAKKFDVADVGKGREGRDGRMFGIVNAVQWVTVFLILNFFPKLGYADLAFPAVLLVVGLHFFFLPRYYRHRSNLLTGGVLVLWAVLCPFLFSGDRMIAFVALGAGLTLWLSAAWALAVAAGHLRRARNSA